MRVTPVDYGKADRHIARTYRSLFSRALLASNQESVSKDAKLHDTWLELGSWLPGELVNY